jgi:hypothetical protein
LLYPAQLYMRVLSEYLNCYPSTMILVSIT